MILGDSLNITQDSNGFLPPPLTWRTAPERGSMMRSFLSLQLVASRLPSVLKDMLRMTSVWQSIIFTGSPISRFQIRICQDQQGLFRWRGSKADDLVWSFGHVRHRLLGNDWYMYNDNTHHNRTGISEPESSGVTGVVPCSRNQH